MLSEFLSQFAWIDLGALVPPEAKDLLEMGREALSSTPVLVAIVVALGIGIAKQLVKLIGTAIALLVLWLVLKYIGIDVAALF